MDVWDKIGNLPKIVIYGNGAILEEIVGAKILGFVHGRGEYAALYTTKGIVYFRHEIDCCEHVVIDGIDGWTDAAIGETIVSASERIVEHGIFGDEHLTSTFYTVESNSLDLSMKWQGSSNGFYSETVDLSLHSMEGVWDWEENIPDSQKLALLKAVELQQLALSEVFPKRGEW